MAALPLSTLRTRTRELLNDTSNSPEFSDAQILKALNWAQLQVATKLGLTYTEATSSVGATLTLPSDCVHVVRVYT